MPYSKPENTYVVRFRKKPETALARRTLVIMGILTVPIVVLVLYKSSIYESLSRDMLHCWGCCGLVSFAYRLTVYWRIQPQPPCRVVNQLDTARRFMWNEVTSGKRPVDPAASIHNRGGITHDHRRH